MSSDYHKQYERVSKTMLGHFADSINDYYRYYIAESEEPPKPKRQMVVGSAVHKILLERVAVLDCVVRYTSDCFKSNGALNPKPAADFREANPNKFVVKDSDYFAIVAACDSVRKHELGTLIRHEDAVFEVPQYWTDEATQLDCRLMADFYLDVGHEILAYDLKTTERVYPGAVKRTARQFKYWLQDAHYSSGLRTIYGKPVKFRFWFVEMAYPYRVAPFEYLETSRDNANDAYRNLMGRLSDCYALDSWDDTFTSQVNYLRLDPWDVETVDEEVEYVAED